MLDRNSVYAWSILSPTPTYCIHETTGAHIVYWQGVVMTRVHALILVQENWVQSYATPTMKACAYTEFKQYYRNGAFGSVPSWGYILDNTNANDYLIRLRKYIRKNNANLFEELIKQYSLKEAMLWFSRAEMITDG